MRFGLREKLVTLVVAVLAAALFCIGTGSTRFEARVISQAGSQPVSRPAIAELTRYYVRHHSWIGVDRMPAPARADRAAALLVAGGIVRASSVAGFVGARAVRGSDASLTLRQSGVASGAPHIAIRIGGATALPIVVGGHSVATVYAVPAPPRLETRTIQNSYRRNVLVLFAVVSAIAIAIAYVVATALIAPVAELTAAARRASASTMPRVEVRSGDEIGELAHAFNALGGRLMQSEAMRRELLIDIAHELRTPLTNVRCALESFQDGVDSPTPAAIDSVLAEVRVLQRLIGDLHDLRAADAGRAMLACDEIDIVNEARRVVAAFAGRAAQRHVRIDLQATCDVPTAYADAVRIRQVIHNLVENALRHGKTGGAIAVSITRQDGSIHIAVRDDGPGFARSEEARIFERFHRVDVSRSRATGGSGLGLAIAKQLVEAHGGTIGANGGDGRGATVWFAIPASTVVARPGARVRAQA